MALLVGAGRDEISCNRIAQQKGAEDDRLHSIDIQELRRHW